VLWEDAGAWIYFRDRRTKRSRSHAFEMRAHLDGLNSDAVAELIRATLRDLESVKVNWQARLHRE
jgi:hypothetical protein